MKSVVVPFSTDLKFSDNPTLNVDLYKWANTSYEPMVEVFLCHDNEKLAVKFVAYEDEFSIKALNDNEKVYCDNCVEMFIRPFDDDMRYINFEVNPLGSMIMNLNRVKGDRDVLVYKYKTFLNVITERKDNCWTLSYQVPFGMLSEIYGRSDVRKSGDTINANFYKCGDETKYPHFGMWNEIPGELASFHQPQHFGKLVLE